MHKSRVLPIISELNVPAFMIIPILYIALLTVKTERNNLTLRHQTTLIKSK